MARPDKRKREPGVRISPKTKNLIREIRELSPRKYSSDDQLIQEQLAPLYDFLSRRAGIPKTPKSPPVERAAPPTLADGQSSAGAPAPSDGGP